MPSPSAPPTILSPPPGRDGGPSGKAGIPEALRARPRDNGPMRIAVVGASGNVGTAVRRELEQRTDVTGIVGLCRRPLHHGAPSSPGTGPRTTWRSVDIGRRADSRAQEQHEVDTLAAALAGCDAVIHLAWLIQPNRDRDLLRRVNVDGTRRVAQAAAQAGVRTLVCASSMGAYSPAPDRAPRDETWPTGGVRTSHYSVDKAAQERVLAEVGAQHPGMAIVALRTGLVFQAEAAAEIAGYFLGPLVPETLLRTAVGFLRDGFSPVIPVPAGVPLQLVHASDAARAYVDAAVHPEPDSIRGAFNIAAPPVLGGQLLADAIGGGMAVPVPVPVLRRAVALAYELRLIPTDPGWLDMARACPVMDTTRARTVLGWEPRHDAVAVLREMLDGLAVGARGDEGGPLG